MSSRYHVAMAKGVKFYEAIVQEDRDLLHFFGLRLLAVESVVRAAVESEIKGKRQINPWNVVEIDMKTWELFRPLLVEARESRQKKKRAEAAAFVDLLAVAAK